MHATRMQVDFARLRWTAGADAVDATAADAVDATYCC